MSEKIRMQLTGIPETLLIPLYTRAVESQRTDSMLVDEKAVDLVGCIDFDHSRIKLQKHDELAIILRVREFDRVVRSFLESHPDGVVVHIGCGLDTRFERVDNGHVEWYDLDLPEVIQLRQKLIPEENERHHLISASVFERGWMDAVQTHSPRAFLFIAEGVFPYFERSQVHGLVNLLREKFPGLEIVFDAHTPFVIWSDNLQLALSGVKARLHFSLKNGREVESWADDIQMLEEWFYFKTDEARVRPYHWMTCIPFLAKSTGIFHYRLG